MEPNKKRNIALESTRERQVNPAGRILFEEGVARCRHDANDFDRLVLLFRFIQVSAPADVAAAASLGRRRIWICILNALSERITIRPEFLCQNFVDDRNLRTGLGRLRFGERATANHWQSNG